MTTISYVVAAIVCAITVYSTTTAVAGKLQIAHFIIIIIIM